MQRRAFVRLVGGGVMGAALPGCGPAMPPEAVAAWRGPGDEADLRRWLLGHAILAPHSHNLQSWLVDLRTPDEIVLRCDRARLLPETDPFGRQILMSHGTFLELLDLAARERGHHAEITLFPDGAFAADRIDDRPVARVRLQPDAGAVRDPLFAQILRRHTNRNVYDAARAVPDAAWTSLAAAARREGLVFGHTSVADPLLQRHRDIANEAWRIEMVTPRAMLETYRVLRVGADEINRHRDGLSLTDPLVVALTRLGLFDRRQPPAADSRVTRQQLDDFARKIASTPAFLWLVSQGNTRRAQVEAGRAYARVQLAATAQGLALHPLQQALQEYPEQRVPHADIHQLLQAPPATHTVQMWARVGFAEPVGPAPRRGVDALLVKA